MSQQVEQKKLTPKEAFECLQVVFPWVTEIRKCSTDGYLMVLGGHLPGIEIQSALIDWGDITSYKPKLCSWRPAIASDLSTAILHPLPCRVAIGDKLVYGKLTGGRCTKESPVAYVEADPRQMNADLYAVLLAQVEIAE